MGLSELREYAEKLRSDIVAAVKKNGGHLSSGLGAVEIILAMHYVFDAKNDKFIFDVGHQAYAHKMLTGRAAGFDALRTRGGISGFPNPAESGFDAFVTGHSSTSLSLAAGFLRAKKLGARGYKVVVFVGDGAMTGGMTYEALNDLRAVGERAVIILNDNGKPYSGSESGFSAYLSDIKNGLIKEPFKEYGAEYRAVDGHDLGALIDVFEYAKSGNAKRSIVIHAETVKGKGLAEAENAPEAYHGIARPAAKADGAESCGCKNAELKSEKTFSETAYECLTEGGNGGDTECKSKKSFPGSACECLTEGGKDGDTELKSKKTFSETAGEYLTELAKDDARITAVTAAMGSGTGLSGFAKAFPDRFFDVGICEAHAVTMSAALSREGYIPFAAIYSSFLQRSFDSLIHDVGIMNNNVKLLVDRAGLIAEDGETHQGIFDLGFLRLVPGMVILSPRDGLELKRMMKKAAEYNGAVAIRYPKGSVDIACGLSVKGEAVVSGFGKSEKTAAASGENKDGETAANCQSVTAADTNEVDKNGKRAAVRSENDGGETARAESGGKNGEKKLSFKRVDSQNGGKVFTKNPTADERFSEFGLEKIAEFGREFGTASENVIIAADAVMLREAVGAAKICERKGVGSTVVYAPRIKPLDEKGLSELALGKNFEGEKEGENLPDLKGEKEGEKADGARRARRIFVVEDNVKSGGFGSAAAEFFAERFDDLRVYIFAVRDAFPGRGTREELLESEGIDALGISEKIMKIIGKTT
jgi:1-deoxy-D-xylulose-5-phosphate synthase